MYSIEKNLDNISSYSFIYNHNNALCYLLHIYKSISKKEIENYLNIVKEVSKISNFVLIIDPTIDYKIVSQFQLNNVHILRLSLDIILTKKNHSFYLVNKKEEIVFINSSNNTNDSKKINLDLYIPNYTKNFDLSSLDFNYDIYLDTAIVTLKNKKDEKKISDFFKSVLKIKKVIVVYSNNKYFARFINNSTLLVSDENDNTKFDNNIKKLKDNDLDIVITNNEVINNYFLVNKNILVKNNLLTKYKDLHNILQQYFKDSIITIDYKLENNDLDLVDVLIPLPKSNSHIYYEKEVEIKKKFKERN